jgi:hypothetical protein
MRPSRSAPPSSCLRPNNSRLALCWTAPPPCVPYIMCQPHKATRIDARVHLVSGRRGRRGLGTLLITLRASRSMSAGKIFRLPSDFFVSPQMLSPSMSRTNNYKPKHPTRLFSVKDTITKPYPPFELQLRLHPCYKAAHNTNQLLSMPNRPELPSISATSTHPPGCSTVDLDARHPREK